MSQPSITAPTGSKTRKLIMQMVVGAIAGASVTYLALGAIEGSGFDLDDPSRVGALLIAIVFLLMGVFVGAGVLVPGLGARILNVEDAEELREQRRLLADSAIGCVLIGVFLLALAAAGGDGMSRTTIAVVAGLCLAGILVTSVRSMSGIDELMRRISTESSALALYAIVVLVGGWAALAHLGFTPWIEPLALIATFALVELAAIFWVCGKRGLLKER